MEGLLDITDQEFRQIADLVYQRFGINLSDKKKVLVRGRLNKLLKTHRYGSFKEYYDDILADTSGKNLLTLIDKISTNHSFFFREADHFTYLSETVLPELSQKGHLQSG
ncbi:MAG: chemotaxis protein CheR, partial [Spirochaetales bacterium]|nr:chemotaxis protein CheR [Spirochaetales bacterium]